MRTQEPAKKRKIGKGKEEQSQNIIQKDSRTKGNIINQNEQHFKQEESQNKENTERDGDKDINRNKENRHPSELQQDKQQQKKRKSRKKEK